LDVGRVRAALRLGALLALAACAGEPPNGPTAVCKQEAENDPNVVALRDRGLGNPQTAFQLRPDLEFARKEAVNACLRRKGLLPPGGVEPVRPST
jgi:hypothetical protein